MTGTHAPVGAVVIGRNEGARLVSCLASLQGQVDRLVYVDSGSTDGSVAAARAHGAEVVDLDMSAPFTAARARNAGLSRLRDRAPGIGLVQFLDGDCDLVAGWIETARHALLAEPDLAVVCGRRREKFPEASLWNRVIDREWDTPTGEAEACGGDALMRIEALEAVGGYRGDLIAGEEPEMCYRMRRTGWRIRRIDAEMTRHDAAMTRFGQWWKRARRAGHSYAELAALHGRGPERLRVAEARRAVLWGAVLPALTVLAALVLSPWALLLLLAYPAQVLRLILRGTPPIEAVLLTVGKFPEALGWLDFRMRPLSGRRALIEYK